jgi:hypothetical protein
MLAMAHDTRRVILVALHVGDALTDGELEAMLAAIARMAAAVEERADAIATSVVIVETDHAPTATQRRRIAEAAQKVKRSREAMITKSAIVRGVMTAIRWIARADENRLQGTFPTYADARAWLQANTSHPLEVFDALHRDVRAQVSATAKA